MESPVRSTLIFPETRVSSPKSPQCSIASCSPPISPRQEILSDRDLHPPPKQKQKQKQKQKEKQKQKLKQKRKHWGPCASDKPFPCSHSRPHSDEGLDEGHVDGPRRKRRKIRFFQNRFFQNHFSKGDVVWAKAFPYTWWPGWIGRIEGSFAWVSFYGSKKSRRFRVLEICGFEESYGRISKMAGVKLADEINLALEDFSRRTVIALTSCCWVSPVESSGVSADHIARVRERFDSRGMLRFVNDLGVSACVADEETARVVRLSAQVYAYRSYASMCRHSELAGDFSAADMLEFARDFAVSLFIDSVGDSVLLAVLDRFDEFGRFVSVCPGWMYRQRVELEEAFPSDESLGKEDLSDLSSGSEIVYGGIVDPDDEFLDNILDTEFEITQQQELEVLEGPEVCMLNQADYVFFDMDEEYESLPNCLEVAVEQGNSTWKGISVDPTLELETPFTGMSLMEVDFDTTCNKNILSADDGSVFHANEQAPVHLSCYKDDNLPENVEDILNSPNIPLSREIVAYGNISLSNLESEKGEEKDDIAMNIDHEDDDSTAEQRFSVNFPTDETVSSDEEIKFTGAQSSSDVSSVVQDGVPRGVIDNSSTVASSADQRFSVNFPTDKTVSSDKEIKFIGAQSSSDVCCVVQDGVPRGVIDNNSTVASSAEQRFSVKLPTDETVSSDKEIKFPGAQSSSDVCCVVQDGVPRGVIDNSSTVASSAEQRFSVNFPTDETVSSDKEIKFTGAQSSSDVCCVVQDGVPRGVIDNSSTVASSAEQRFSVNLPTDETVSSDKEIKFTGAQSSSDVCSVVQDGVSRGVIDNSSSLASPTKALSPNSIERRRDNLVNNFFKLHKSLVPYAEALSYAKVFVEYVTSTGYDTCSYDGSITGNNIDEKKALLAASSEHCSPSGANKTDKTNGFHRLTLPNCASSRKIRQKKHDKLISSGSLKWTRFYSSPMMRERSKPTSRAKKSSSISRPPTSPKSLHMKFPKDFIMPSKEELEKKFRVFGRLDRSRTKLFFYTGAALVVFLRNTDADAAYRYVKQKSIFDCANVRFWFDEHEKFRMKPSSNDHIIPEKEVLSSLDYTPSHECIGVVQKEDNTKILCRGDSHKSTSPNMGHSPSNLKSCLKSPDARNGENSKKACKVRFTIET